MTDHMVMADTNVTYNVKEAAVLVAALAWVIVVGSVAMAAIIICGWRGAKSVALDWVKMKATFTCR